MLPWGTKVSERSAVTPSHESRTPLRRPRTLGYTALGITVAAFLILPVILTGPALGYQITELQIAILFAVSVSFVIGMAGVPAFGNQIFYGAGAYMVAELSTRYHVTGALEFLGAALLTGVVLGALLCILLKWISGLAFGMVTIALGQVAYIYVSQSGTFAGSNGISGISAGSLFGFSLNDSTRTLAFVTVVTVIGAILVALLRRSKWGLLLRAGRDSTSRALAVGINVRLDQAVAFIVGAALSSVAGGLAASAVGTVDPSIFYWTIGAVPLLAGLIGGVRTFWGPILGALILQSITIWISTITVAWLTVEGLVVLGVYLIWPEGIIGEGRESGFGSILRLIRRYRNKRVRATLPLTGAGLRPSVVPPSDPVKSQGL